MNSLVFIGHRNHRLFCVTNFENNRFYCLFITLGDGNRGEGRVLRLLCLFATSWTDQTFFCHLHKRFVLEVLCHDCFCQIDIEAVFIFERWHHKIKIKMYVFDQIKQLRMRDESKNFFLKRKNAKMMKFK